MKSYGVVVCLSLFFAALPVRAEVALSAAGVQDRLMVLFRPGVTEGQQRRAYTQAFYNQVRLKARLPEGKIPRQEEDDAYTADQRP